MKAQFSGGRCGICQERIEAGEDIDRYDGEWCHESCAEDEGMEPDGQD